MKPIRIVWLLAILLFGNITLESGLLKAGHNFGFEIRYSCLNSCTTRVFFSGYYDCASPSSNSPNLLTWYVQGGGNCSLPPAVGNWSTGTDIEITPISAGATSQCTDPNAVINGVKRTEWYRDYNTCQAGNCVFEIGYYICCRNTSATSNANFYTYSTFDNTLSGCNNSPQYRTEPVVYMCTGKGYNVHLGATDPDGDSLSYRLGPCLAGSNQSIPYKPGFSFSQPLGSSWSIDFNQASGQLTFSPTPGNFVTANICVYTDEWRNGVKVGEYIRDFMVVALSCPNNSVPSINSISVSQGNATISGDTVFSCGGDSICVDILAQDPDPADTLDLFWNGEIGSASFFDVGTQTPDTSTGLSPAGRFCWGNPGIGQHNFLLRVRDNFSPIYALDDRLITLDVHPSGTFVSTTNSGCLQVDFSALACGGNGNYTYNWNGAGGIGNTSQSFTHTFASSGQYQFSVIVTDGAGYLDTISGSVNVNGSLANNFISPNFDTISTCADSVQLTAITGLPNISWSTGSDSSSIGVTTSGTYTLEVSDTFGCSFTDTIVVQLQPPTYINGLIQTSGRLKFCAPTSIQMTASPFPFSTYTWTNGDTSTATQTTNAGTHYVNITDTNGCISYDSVVLSTENFPDVSGTVITGSASQPMISQPVIAFELDSANAVLIPIDTAFTDSTGAFEICYIDKEPFYIRVEPGDSNYPIDFPTYDGDTLFWNGATQFNQSSIPVNSSITTIDGVQPSGSGTISGTITAISVGGPAVNLLRVFAIEINTGMPVDYTETDASGKFSFVNLPHGDYALIPDKPFVQTTYDTVPIVKLSASTPSLDSLVLVLHPTWLELVSGVSIAEAQYLRTQEFTAYPNPFVDFCRMRFYLATEEEVSIEVITITGRVVCELVNGAHKPGVYVYGFCPADYGLPPGPLMVRFKAGNRTAVSKIIGQ